MTHEGRPKPTGVSVGRVGDPRRAPELKRLEVFIGRWMTEGETAPGPNGASARIVASDIYQWLPGGHSSCIAGVGGLEVIGYDSNTGQYVTYFFDSEGNVTSQALLHRDGTWTWQDKHARCTGVFTTVAKH